MESKTETDRLEKIAQDTHKAFSYNKSTDLWSWYDRDEPNVLYGVFDTRHEALLAAVEPYTSTEA